MEEGLTRAETVWMDVARTYRDQLLAVCRELGVAGKDDLLPPSMHTILGALRKRTDTVPRECMKRRLAKRQRQIDESHEALRRRNEELKRFENANATLLQRCAEMKRRLMPEGMEWLVEAWPRFEDDAPVRFGDAFRDHQGNARSVLTVKMWQEGGFEIGTGQGTYDWHSAGERVKRPMPKALDADGAEIRARDHVWHVETGQEYVVVSICYEDGIVVIRAGDKTSEHEQYAPSLLTHRAPVLAADGRPLREGETVWGTRDMEPMKVVDTDSHECGFKHVKCEKEGDGFWFYCPDELTHERPDSWERLEEDAKADPGEYCVTHELCAAYMGGEAEEYAKARDLVRRAKALAERGM